MSVTRILAKIQNSTSYKWGQHIKYDDDLIYIHCQIKYVLQQMLNDILIRNPGDILVQFKSYRNYENKYWHVLPILQNNALNTLVQIWQRPECKILVDKIMNNDLILDEVFPKSRWDCIIYHILSDELDGKNLSFLVWKLALWH